ncbi:MAG TPA: PEP/pyruvate-binding domain-containing protein [Polyangiaceae bacterium]|nr:PEP/pyruvate-binding domain-containing protein [Polyangiaceae bacterium]
MTPPVPLDEAADPERFGGKAAGLARALHAGLPAPPGFALSAEFVEAVAERMPAALSALSELARKLEPSVAVRSSAIGEDSSSASFAGQHKTLLNVASASGLESAVREVWLSARSASALAYRARMGLTERSIRMGVVVQPMLDPETAGVLFTRNPVSGADERVVEAALGLGESVVMGLVTPDLYRLARGGRLLEARAGTKDTQIRPAPNGGTLECEVTGALATQCCLEAAQLEALEQLASACERVFDGPRDLEWAFVNGQLFLLQCRAVTR